MKRSEMFKIIHDAIMKPIPYNDDGGLQLQIQTMNVLKAIEDAGMLPPEREIKVEAEAATWYYDGHEWEPEDDKK